jgi:hypothetical protein
MPSIIRKNKINLVNLNNDTQKIIITINIESNHVNNNLDNILETINNLAVNIPNYKIEIPEPKIKPVKVIKNKFGSNAGNYV